jgi:DNA-binding transcriptional MerR regulator
MKLYTIAEMAKLLKIPESTARYYRDRHPEYLHYTGKGRKRRYTAEALEALRFICEQANNSRNADDIDQALQARFNKEINHDDITAVTTAEEQQLKLMNTLTDTLSSIADQKIEIQALREEIKELREYIKTPVLKRIFKKRISLN